MDKNINIAKSNKPFFFLFTCVKDGRQYINRLFGSLLSQTSTCFMHYIYDDGSKEPLDELVEEYKRKVLELPAPFEVIYEKNPVNIGLNMATKHCIDQCCCPYFIWIDCDNWIEPTFFEEMRKTAIKNPNAILIKSNRTDYFADGTGKKMFSSSSLNKHTSPSHFIAGTFLFSIFAVKYDKYLETSDNFFVDEKFFFNDAQVLSHCVFSSMDFVFCKKAMSNVLIRADSEYHRHREKIEEIYKTTNNGIKEIAKKDKWGLFNCLDYVHKAKYENRQTHYCWQQKNIYEMKNHLSLWRLNAKSKTLPKVYRKLLMSGYLKMVMKMFIYIVFFPKETKH